MTARTSIGPMDLSVAGANDIASRMVFGLHRELYRRTGGRFIGNAFGMPVIILRTTGRKSGKIRETMLTSPIQEGDSVVIVASYGGDKRRTRRGS